MNFSTQTASNISSIASLIAIIVFFYSITAYFINNRRKCKNNKRKIKYIVANFNCNFLSGLKKNGFSFDKVKEKDLQKILDKFENDDSLFEKLFGVYKELETYSELKGEIIFLQLLEKVTIVLVAVIMCSVFIYNW